MENLIYFLRSGEMKEVDNSAVGYEKLMELIVSIQGTSLASDPTIIRELVLLQEAMCRYSEVLTMVQELPGVGRAKSDRGRPNLRLVKC
jgi:hypothetical protein